MKSFFKLHLSIILNVEWLKKILNEKKTNFIETSVVLISVMLVYIHEIMTLEKYKNKLVLLFLL